MSFPSVAPTFVEGSARGVCVRAAVAGGGKLIISSWAMGMELE